MKDRETTTRSRELGDELRRHEATASTIHEYEPLVIPGLLQTENYARTLFQWTGLEPSNAIETRVRARIDRQSLLRRRQPPEVNFYIHEHALRASDDPQIMNEQLLHLALISGQPRCTIRIVPSAVPHGVLGGPFRLMQYGDHGPVAYAENQTSSVFLEHQTDIAAYQAILNQLAEVALDGGQSREHLVRLANDYDQPEEGDDGHG